MRILHVTKKYPNALGGDAVVVSNLEKQQKLNGDQVSILTSNCDEIISDHHVYKFGLKDNTAALDTITFKRLISLIHLFFIAFSVIRRTKPTVIHTHSIDMAFFVSFAARFYKVPIIHTFHIVTFNDPQLQGLRSKVELALLKGTRASKVTILNPSDIKDFLRAGFKNVVYIPNGVNLKDWQRGSGGRKHGLFTFIAVGRLEEQKGFRYLIDASSKLARQNVHFKVIIVGEGSMRETLDQQIEREGLSKIIELVGRKDQAELSELYASSDAFILSSLWEGMPLSLLEAWASNLPVLATSINSIPTIAKGAALLVPPEDSEALSLQMSKLMADNALRKSLGENGQNRVTEKYQWSVIANIMYRGIAS